MDILSLTPHFSLMGKKFSIQTNSGPGPGEETAAEISFGYYAQPLADPFGVNLPSPLLSVHRGLWGDTTRFV